MILNCTLLMHQGKMYKQCNSSLPMNLLNVLLKKVILQNLNYSVYELKDHQKIHHKKVNISSFALVLNFK